MSAIYPHKRRGFQVRFTIYFPDGTSREKYRYFQFRPEADRCCRECEFLEAGSRAGRLSRAEVVQAQHDKYITDAEARLLSGGKVVALYDVDRVFASYRDIITISHSPVALEKSLGRVANLRPWFDAHPIPFLVETDIRNFILDRRNGVIAYRNAKTGRACRAPKPKTISNELGIIIGIIDAAKGLGMVEENVARLVKVPLRRDSFRRAMKRTEIAALIETAERKNNLLHGQIYELVMIGLYTGFRRTELQMLTWPDVDLEMRKIFVQSKEIEGGNDFDTKSGTARYKSIPDRLMPIFRGMQCRGRFVFGGDAPYDKDVISHAVKDLMKIAGLPPDLSLHSLRHTYGSWLLRRSGGDLKMVQDEMGHLDIETTKKNYLHTIIDEDDPVLSFDYE